MTRKKLAKNRNDSGRLRINSSDTSVKSTAQSGSSRSGIGRVKGLSNLGNTCYFNSMLQMLLNSPNFIHRLKAFCSNDYEMVVETPTGVVTLVLKQADVSCVEKELIKIWESAGASASPAGLRNALLKNDQFRAHFHGFNEQDSHEAFLVTLNVIKEAQVRRIRKAVLAHYQCDGRSAIDPSGAEAESAPISDETRVAIRTLGLLATRQSPVQTQFGLAVASALRCGSCDVLRLRFDECLNLSPPLESLAEREVVNRDGPRSTGVQQTTDTPQQQQRGQDDSGGQQQPHKLSKHQLKKQKRIERKTKRIRKASIRNAECTPGLEQEPNSDVTETETHRVDTDSAYDTLSADIETQEVVVTNPCLHDDSDLSPTIDDITSRLVTSVVLSNGYGDVMSPESYCAKTDNSGTPITTNGNENHTIIGSNDRLTINDNNDDKHVTIDDNNESKMKENNGDSTITNNNHGSMVTCNSSQPTSIDNNKLSGTTCSNEQASLIDNNKCASTTGECAVTSDTDQSDTDCAIDKPDTSHIHDNWNDNMSERPLDPQALQRVFQAVLNTHSVTSARRPQTDLERALAQFVAPQPLDGLACDSCSPSGDSGKTAAARQPHIKIDRVCHAPAVLPIYISRFKQGAKRGGAKNSQHYSFPAVLDLSPQCSRLANVQRRRPVLYRLYGIIEHLGARINTGHYVSYVSARRPTTATPTPTGDSTDEDLQGDWSCPADWLDETCRRFGERRQPLSPDCGSDDDTETEHRLDYDWYRISDCHVEPVSLSTALSCQAFMLFYWRIQ